jgi:hypothetical protein
MISQVRFVEDDVLNSWTDVYVGKASVGYISRHKSSFNKNEWFTWSFNPTDDHSESSTFEEAKTIIEQLSNRFFAEALSEGEG